jgi:hypothetical protein
MNVVKSKSFQTNDLPRGKGQTPATKLNLYNDIPNIEVSLDDFEEFALDRLKVGNPAKLQSRLLLNSEF